LGTVAQTWEWISMQWMGLRKGRGPFCLHRSRRMVVRGRQPGMRWRAPQASGGAVRMGLLEGVAWAPGWPEAQEGWARV